MEKKCKPSSHGCQVTPRYEYAYLLFLLANFAMVIQLTARSLSPMVFAQSLFHHACDCAGTSAKTANGDD